MKERGMTLVEVVIVIFISALIMLAFSDIFVSYNSSYAYQNASINASIAASSFLNELSDTVHQADAIISSRTVSGITYTTGSTTVILEIPAINNSGDVITNTFDYEILYASSTNLYRILDANATSARASGTKQYSNTIQNLTFSYDNASPTLATSVTADLSIQAQAKYENASIHLKQQVYLRNK